VSHDDQVGVLVSRELENLVGNVTNDDAGVQRDHKNCHAQPRQFDQAGCNPHAKSVR
jgi:hypothetical protein